MKAIALIGLLCIAATIPPLPKHYRSGEVPRGAGASKLIAKVTVTQPWTNTFTWQYPASIDPASMWWNIEQATSVKGPWSVLISNATGAAEVTVDRKDALRVYRLSGRISP